MTKKVKKSLLFATCIIFGMSVMGLAACVDNSSEEPYTGQPDELKYHYNYELFGFAEPDEFMSVDGKLEENEWQNKIAHVNVEDNVVISTKSVFTDLGLYVGVEVIDQGIYYAADFNMNKNSSIKLTICPVDMITPIYDNDEITVDMDTKNSISDCVIKYAFATTVQGGEVNSGTSTGMTAEFFLPWTELSLEEEGKPEQIRISTSYNQVTGADSNATNRWFNPGFHQRNPSLCYVFDENGYTQKDNETDLMGDSYSGLSKTAGWDLSDAENGIYHTVRKNNQWLFFKGISAESYILQAKVRIVGGIEDAYPHAGLLIGRNETQKNALLIDARPAWISSNRMQLRTLTQAGTTWTLNEILYHDTAFSLQNEIDMKVIKNGSLLYYVINDTYICSDELLGMEGKTEPGLYAVGCEVYFSDVSCTVYDVAKTEEKENLATEIARYTNTITIPENIRGGSITSPRRDVLDGEDLKISLNVTAGYSLEKFEINGVDKLADLRENIQGDTYVIENITEALEFDVAFAKLSDVKIRTVKGKVDTVDGWFEKKANILVIDTSDCLKVYSTTATETSGYTLRVPEGEYEIRASLDGYATKVETFTVSGATLERDKMTLQSAKGLLVNAQVELDSGEICEGTINYNYFSDGSVIGETAGHGYTYLKDAHGERIMVEASIKLVSNPTDMDPSVGFTFSTKSNADAYGFTVLCWRDGLRIGNIEMLRNGNSAWGINKTGLRSTTIRDTKKNGFIRLAVVRDAATYYVFLDGNFVDKYTIDYTQGETVVGFYTAGCSAQFSDYNWSTDSATINEWINLSKADPYNKASFINNAVVGYNEDFVVETQLYCKEVQSGNTWQMAGFSFTSSDVTNGDDGFSICIYKNQLFIGRLYTNSYNQLSSIPFTSYTETNASTTLTLKVVKYVGNYFVFVNDQFVYVSQNDAFIKTAGADICVALQCWGTKAGFENTTFVSGETEAKNALKGIAPTEKTLDGDLSDWNEATWTGEQANSVRANAVSATNAQDSFKAMAYLGSDGVYLAIEIVHTNAYNAYAITSSEWWNYSYVAMFLNSTNNATMKNQTLVSPDHQHRLFNGYTYGNVASKIVTKQKDNKYVTTMEIFVPWAACDNYSAYQNGDTLRMGFDCNFGTGTLRPHGGPDELANQYYLTENGLTLTAPSVN